VSGSAQLPQPLAEALNETYVLREGRVLRIPNLPELPLAGVLRSELQDRVTELLRGTLRDPRVRAEPKIQVSLAGAVARPGYHWVAPDMLLADVLMSPEAGNGVVGGAEMRRSMVRRGGKVVIKGDSLQTAISAGATLDRIDYRSGDQIVVGERASQSKWMFATQVLGAVTGVVFLIFALSDRF
jgi:protein involved in polysaccharide export with SLBB domain